MPKILVTIHEPDDGLTDNCTSTSSTSAGSSLNRRRSTSQSSTTTSPSIPSRTSLGRRLQQILLPPPPTTPTANRANPTQTTTQPFTINGFTVETQDDETQFVDTERRQSSASARARLSEEDDDDDQDLPDIDDELDSSPMTIKINEKAEAGFYASMPKATPINDETFMKFARKYRLQISRRLTFSSSTDF